MAAAPGGAESGLIDRLHLVAIHLIRLLRVQEDAAGVSGPRLLALRAIAERGPLPLGELADAERVRSPTMVGTVKELERRGLVRKEAHPDDKRVTLVSVTGSGIVELNADRDRVRRALSGALGNIEPAAVELLRGCVDTLYGVLAREEPQGPGPRS
jgi:DNA-binding MarR family transcriptional regulator